MKKIKLLMPLLASTTLIGATVATIGCSWPGKTIKAIDFNTCDWADVIDACNKLENGQWTEKQFCKRFKFGDVQATKLDDFVGKERTTMLIGHEHKVMVIGTNQDQYKKDGKDHNAALTFQFINLISDESTGAGLSTSWNDDGTGSSKNYNYWNSTINKALNDDISFTEWKDFSGNPVDEDRSVMMMINDSNSVLYNGIKSVSRTVIVSNEGTTWALSTKQTKLFCPCLGNYFSNKGINDEDFLEIPQQIKDLYCSEATQYQYYVEALGDTMPSYTETSLECMNRKDLAGNKLGCWVATPYIYGTNDKAWRVNDRVEDESVDGYQAITPCFCL